MCLGGTISDPSIYIGGGQRASLDAPKVSLIPGLGMTVACGPASVQRVSGPSGQLPRPDRILVYDFAVTPDEVRLHPEPPRRSRSGMRWPMPWPTPS